MLVDFNVHFSILVVTSRRNNLESFVKTIRQEYSAVNILLEVGSNGSSCSRAGDNAIREAAAAKQVELSVVVVEGNRSRRSCLQGEQARSAAHGEGSAALSDDGASSTGNRANTNDNVLALNQFSWMVESHLSSMG